MVASTSSLKSGLFYRHWAAEGVPQGVVLISHGLGEHSGRYDDVAQALIRQQLHVYALDHIGHGHSPGRRAFIKQFSELTQGVTELRAEIAEQYQDLPVILVGHSMGGLIAARVMLDAQDDYSGLILTGPALGVPTPPPWWQVALLRVLSALMPASKALAIDAKAVSRDPSVVDAYTADPLVHHDNIPARMVVSLFDEGQFVLDNAGHITLPVLLLHGEEDQLTSVPASRQFIEALGASDKHLTIYPGMYHELFNEPERAEIIDTCIAWIRQRLV